MKKAKATKQKDRPLRKPAPRPDEKKAPVEEPSKSGHTPEPPQIMHPLSDEEREGKKENKKK